MLKIFSLLLISSLSFAAENDMPLDADLLKAGRRNAPCSFKMKSGVIAKKLKEKQQRNNNDKHISRKDRKEDFNQIIEDEVNLYESNKLMNELIEEGIFTLTRQTEGGRFKIYQLSGDVKEDSNRIDDISTLFALKRTKGKK